MTQKQPIQCPPLPTLIFFFFFIQKYSFSTLSPMPRNWRCPGAHYGMLFSCARPLIFRTRSCVSCSVGWDIGALIRLFIQIVERGKVMIFGNGGLRKRRVVSACTFFLCFGHCPHIFAAWNFQGTPDAKIIPPFFASFLAADEANVK